MGKGLARHRLLIQECLAADDGAVGGEAVSVAHGDEVSRPESGGGDPIARSSAHAHDRLVVVGDLLVQRPPRPHDRFRHDELPGGAQPGEQGGGDVIASRQEQEQRRGLQNVAVHSAPAERGGSTQQGGSVGGQDETGEEGAGHGQKGGDERCARPGQGEQRDRRSAERLLARSRRLARRRRARVSREGTGHRLDLGDQHLLGKAKRVVVDQEAARDCAPGRRPDAREAAQPRFDRRSVRREPGLRVAEPESTPAGMRDRVPQLAIRRTACCSP